VRVLFRHQIVKYSLVSILTGIVRTSVVFWLPTYIAQYLQYPTQTAVVLFTAVSLIISLTDFLAVYLYERMGRDMDKTVLLMFSASACFFLLTYLIRLPIVNLGFLMLAIMASHGAACMLWNRYCPSLRDTGMVSSATGFLDFLSYAAAAVANLLFANAVSDVGWKNLILIWMAITGVGVVVSLAKPKRVNSNE